MERKIYAEKEESRDGSPGVRRRKPAERPQSPNGSMQAAAVSAKTVWVQVKYAIERLTLAAAWKAGFKDRKHDYHQFTEKRFREVIVGIQAQLHSKKRGFGLYYYVKLGDLDKVQQMINRDDTLINKRDAAGAAAFHLAYVFQHYHVGHYLVEQFPELALEPYNGHHTEEILDEFPELTSDAFNDAMMPYTGATILHVAIVRRNFEEVRWLLNYYHTNRDVVPDGLSKLLSANVTGKFFAQDGDFYLGGLPLHFAVCANHIAIFDLIMSYASRGRITLPEGFLAPDDGQHAAATVSSKSGLMATAGMPLASLQQNASEVFSMSSKAMPFELPSLFGSSRKLNQDDEANEDGETSRHEGESKGESAPARGSRRDSHQQHEAAKKRSISGQNVLFLPDANGNTVLHLCVRYGAREMYAHIHQAAQRIITAEIKQLYAAYAHKGVGAVVRLQAIPRTLFGYCMLPKVINIPDKDKYDEWVRTEADAKLDELLLLALNADLHSTLTLAAALITRNDSETTRERRIAMLHTLLQYNKTPLWTYGAVKVSRMKLEGIEIKYKLERYQSIPPEKQFVPRHAAIDWLCINDADPRVILLPEIKGFIETKWERVGYPSFLVRFLLHTFVTVLITLIMLFPNASPWFTGLSSVVVLADVLYPIVMVMFGYLFYCEVNDLLKHGRNYLAFRGVARYDKIVRVVKVSSFLLFACYKIAHMVAAGKDDVVDGRLQVPDDVDHVLKVALTVCVMSSWLHVYYFLMGFDSTGPFMLTIFRIVGRKVPYFMRFYAVIVVTFACGLSLLANDGTLQSSYGFMQLLTAIWTLLQGTVGAELTHNSIDIQNDVAPHLIWLADILLTAYYASVVILMINLLIAMIGHTYEEYISYNSALLLIEKYNIMHGLERSMCPVEFEYYRSLYSYRVKVVIDSLQRSNSGKNALARAVSGVVSSVKGSAKGDGDFTKHVTIESSNYDFELQEVNEGWFTTAEALADAARSKANYRGATQRILFLVAPQRDLYPGGSLPVHNAAASVNKIATIIRQHGAEIKQIIVAMATHQYGDITHCSSWENYQSEAPTIGEKITYRSLLEGDWQARTTGLQEWAEIYTKRLEAEHKRTLTILPEHCVTGTRGHSVHPTIDSALQDWAEGGLRSVQYVHFGHNKRTYMCNAMQAAVEDPLDASTALNTGLLNTLLESDQVLVAGPDLGHCVKDTVLTLMNNWGQDLSRLVVLQDGGGVREGMEGQVQAFLSLSQAKGCSVKTCADAFPA